MGEVRNARCEPRSDIVRLVFIFDARGNGGGIICPTITGDHQNRITDYTAIVVETDDRTESDNADREEIL